MYSSCLRQAFHVIYLDYCLGRESHRPGRKYFAWLLYWVSTWNVHIKLRHSFGCNKPVFVCLPYWRKRCILPHSVCCKKELGSGLCVQSKFCEFVLVENLWCTIPTYQFRSLRSRKEHSGSLQCAWCTQTSFKLSSWYFSGGDGNKRTPKTSFCLKGA